MSILTTRRRNNVYCAKHSQYVHRRRATRNYGQLVSESVCGYVLRYTYNVHRFYHGVRCFLPVCSVEVYFQMMEGLIVLAGLVLCLWLAVEVDDYD